MKEEAKDAAAAGAGVKKENSEHGDMQVASLKMERFLQMRLALQTLEFPRC
jgi:hypothetical protein